MFNLKPWVEPAAILGAVVVAGYLGEKIVLFRLRRLVEKTESRADDLILEIVDRNFVFWLILLGVSLAAHASPLQPRAQELIRSAAIAGLFLSVTLVAARLAGVLLRTYTARLAVSAAVAALLQNLAYWSVVAMGGLLVLSNLGVSITPVLTALGVGSLAVALALQDTLGNLFAGVYIVVSNIVDVGDYIKLDSGQEGYVVEVGWRATRIRHADNHVIVPNTRLAQAVVTNYYRPDKSLPVLVKLGVAYGSDLARVERVTVAVGEEVMREVPGGVADFKPLVRYNAFGDSSINFTVVLRGKEFADQYLLTHEFIKKLHNRYKEEGVEIPFPQRVVRLENAPKV